MSRYTINTIREGLIVTSGISILRPQRTKIGNVRLLIFLFILFLVVTCPSLPIPLNGVKVGCLNNLSELYGSQCSFSCNVGYALHGSSSRRCLENGTWSGETSYCKGIKCGALVPPKDGIVSPSTCLLSSNYSQSCKFACQTPGYVIDVTTSRVCSNGGKWTGSNDTHCRDNTPPSFNDTCPSNMVVYTPECSSTVLVNWSEPTATDNSGYLTTDYPLTRPPIKLSTGLHNVLYSASDSSGNRVNCTFIVQIAKTRQAKTLLDIQLYYLANQCSEEIHSQISSNFIALYVNFWGPLIGCGSAEECEVGGVHVECGDQTRILRKRAVEEKKKESQVSLIVQFSLKFPLPSNTSVGAVNETAEKISEIVLRVFNNSNLNMNNSGIVLEYDTSKVPQLRFKRLLCDEGQVLKGIKCVNCPVGFFFNATDCEPCAADQYQDKEAHSSCLNCPSGTSTFGGRGSKRSENCEAIIQTKSNTKESFPIAILVSFIVIGVVIFIIMVLIYISYRKKCCVGTKRYMRKESWVRGISNLTYVGNDGIQGSSPYQMEMQDIENNSSGSSYMTFKPCEDAEGICEHS